MPFPVEIKYIEETAKELDVVFPPQLVQQYQLKNGGEVEVAEDQWTLFPFFDKSDNTRIKRTCNHIALETKKIRGWTNFPQKAVAIGENGGGDMLVLLPVNDNTKELGDTIFLWSHETGETDPVASTFNELLP